jgi:predicted RNase H-like HicB family nuclease
MDTHKKLFELLQSQKYEVKWNKEDSLYHAKDKNSDTHATGKTIEEAVQNLELKF